MDREAKYWRAEYENLRRKKNKEIERMKYQQAKFAHKTLDLLKALGMKDKEIFMYYENLERNNND